MANKDLILIALEEIELCDDCLSVKSGVAPRQTVYTICKQLFDTSAIHRHQGRCVHCHKAKTTNLLVDTNNSSVIIRGPQIDPKTTNINAVKPWFWEGNIQGQVVRHLVQQDYTIRSVADTASRTSGKDIIAISRDNKELWVSVKGYPEKSSNIQARHWFTGALFDLILYHGEDPDVQLCIAFPDGFITYTNLLPRVKWFKEHLSIIVFWVAADGSVREE